MISSAPSVLPALLPSRRRLGLSLLCQETQQQNLKPPQLLPPLSLRSSYDLRLWQEAHPSSVSHVKLGHFLLRFIWDFVFCCPRSTSCCTSFLLSSLVAVCVNTGGFCQDIPACPPGGVRAGLSGAGSPCGR